MSSIIYRRRGTNSSASSDALFWQITEPEVALRMLNELKKKMDYLRLENLVFERYLQDNDPDMLGITTTMVHKPRIQFATESPNRPGVAIASTIGSLSTHKTSGSGSTRTHVNTSMRIELCDKECANHASEIDDIRSRTKKTLRKATASIEEMRLSKDEALDTLKEFHHFVLHKVRYTRVPLERFQLFGDMWLENGNALVETMRLRNSTLKQQTFEMQKALAVKSQLTQILRPVDFEQMQQQCTDMQREVELKDSHCIGLKLKTADVLASLTNNRTLLGAAMDKWEALKAKLHKVEVDCQRYDYVSYSLSEEIESWRNRIDGVKERQNRVQVPTIDAYMERKQQLEVLTRRLKALKHEQAMAEMKLKSTLVKLHRKKAAIRREQEEAERAAKEFEELTSDMQEFQN